MLNLKLEKKYQLRTQPEYEVEKEYRQKLNIPKDINCQIYNPKFIKLVFDLFEKNIQRPFEKLNLSTIRFNLIYGLFELTENFQLIDMIHAAYLLSNETKKQIIKFNKLLFQLAIYIYFNHQNYKIHKIKFDSNTKQVIDRIKNIKSSNLIEELKSEKCSDFNFIIKQLKDYNQKYNSEIIYLFLNISKYIDSNPTYSLSAIYDLILDVVNFSLTKETIILSKMQGYNYKRNITQQAYFNYALKTQKLKNEFIDVFYDNFKKEIYNWLYIITNNIE